MSTACDVSIVIPVYFNAESLPHSWPAVRDAMSGLAEGRTWEVVFVDDGSGDESYARLTEIHAAAPHLVRVLKLTRNFGQIPAIVAGLEFARGRCCVVMSADLQDPPELIPEMVERWNDGATKIVLAARSDREDGPFASLGSRVFYGLMRRYAIPSMPPRGFDFFLIDRVVADFVVKAQEKNSFLQGHVLWTGFEPEVIHYKRMRRQHGRSRWTFWRKVKYFTDGFVTYSIAPIRLITMLGLLVSLAAFVYTVVVAINFFVGGAPMTGWTPLMMCMLFIGGVQLVMLGIIGEYLWRNYDESRALPNYVVESALDEEAAVEAE